MKKTLISTLAATLMIVAAARAPAQETKPVAVVSLPSLGELMKDVAYLGGLADQPQAGAMAQMFAQQAEGLDKSKPMGIAVNSNDDGYTPILFIPVTDVDKLIASLPKLGVQTEDAGDGVTKLTVVFWSAYLKAKGGWAFVAQKAESLTKLPDNPLNWLGGLEKKYDVGMRVNLQNIPKEDRAEAIKAINFGVKAALRQNPDESDKDFALRKELVEKQVDTLIAMINDLDQVTMGWTIDIAAKQVVFEIAITALKDSKTAKQLAQNRNLRTDFSGFLQDDAVLSFNVVSKMTEDDAKQAAQMFVTLRKQFMNQVDASEDFENDEQKTQVKQLVNKLLDVVDGTLKGGRFDGGMAILGEGPFVAAMGFHVADGAAVEKVLTDTIELAKKEAGAEMFKYDVQKVGDLSFHTIAPKMEVTDENVKKALGDDPKIVIGIGKTSVYVAVGSDARKTLEGIIAKSKAGASRAATPMRFSIALGPILRFAAKENPNPILDAVVKALGKGNDDHLRITNTAIPNGEVTRIVIEEGVLKVIAVAVKFATLAAQGRAGVPLGRDF